MTKAYDSTSFTNAKRTIFDLLKTATSGTEGKSCFLGFLPPAFDVWAITFGGGGDVRNTWNVCPPSELHLNGDVEGIFKSQEDADLIGMKIVGALSMMRLTAEGKAPTNGEDILIQCCRLRSGGQIDVFLGPKLIGNENEGKPLNVWILKIGLEVVFNTFVTEEEEDPDPAP
jgi:hypothetical protein